MTDLTDELMYVPGRLGVTGRYEDGQLTLDLTPQPAVLRLGSVRASVVSFLIDAVAGITVDGLDDVWTLTSDLSVRMRPIAAPERLSAVTTILRRGRRSVTCLVEVTTEDGTPAASGAIGFANIPRKETDPPKPIIGPELAPSLFAGLGTLSRPLRDEARIEVIDAEAGIVEIAVTPAVCNPAGTLQGAIVALLAEVAAEELIEARFGAAPLVTDLDVRYLAQAPVGPVRTRSTLLGTGPEATVQVELIDVSTDRITTFVYARCT